MGPARPAAVLCFQMALCLGVLLSAATAWAKLSAVQRKEYEVKSAFIYNFLKFIEWPKKETESSDPPSSDEAKPAPIVVGYLAPVEVYEVCKAIHGRKVKDQTIQTRRIWPVTADDLKKDSESQTLAALLACQVLVFSEDAFLAGPDGTVPIDYHQILQAVKGRPILTIGEMPGFVDAADPQQPVGMINFVLEENKVRFEINQDAAQNEQIQIKAQLLKLAFRVVKKAKSDK